MSFVGGPGTAFARQDEQSSHAEPARQASSPLSLSVGSGKLLRLSRPAKTVFMADPQIADVQVPKSDRIFVFGKKVGRTTLFVLNAEGEPILSRAVEVQPDQTEFRRVVEQDAGDAPVSLDVASGGAILRGTAASPGAAANLAAAAAVTSGGHPVTDQLQVIQPIQVNLRVRVAEVSRTVSRDLGLNWSAIANVGSFAFGLQTGRFATGAQTAASLVGDGLDGIFGSVSSRHVSAASVLDAMANEQLVTMLAEPNLTAVSGGTAKFLAGGEYPIPVPQALGVTSIQYVQYGVSVAFSPVVLGSGLIAIKVRPEVSSIVPTGTYTLNNLTVPALSTRRAETEVDLASGQSFAIAGLIQNDAQNNVQKVPWLGDLPILGQLFRSNQFQRNQTELVIVVTPYIVHPVDPGHAPDDPVKHIEQPTDLEQLLLSRMGDRLDQTALPHLSGKAGFLLE